MKRLLSVLLVAFILVTSVVVPVAAEVTADHTVSTYDDLKNLMSAIDDNDGYAGKVIALEGNIVLGDDWNTLITKKTFKGTLNGQNHTVTLSDSAEMLFYEVQGATIMNLTLVGDVENFTALNGQYHWGSIVRWVGAGETLIESCVNKVNFTVKDTAKQVIAGGLVGNTMNTGTKLTFKNCVNEGNIYSGEYDGYAGGFVGYCRATNGNIFENCVNKGKVEAKATKAGQGRAGGFIAMTGSGNYDFDGCVNEGEIVATNYAGGLIGHINGGGLVTFDDCANKNAVSGNYAGGFAGNLGNATSMTLTNCLNEGAITANTHVGGFIGDARKTTNLVNCLNKGNVVAQTSTAATAGGLIGYAFGITATVTNCGNMGDVSCLDYSKNEGWQGCAGGLIGWMQNYPVMNECFNHGDIVGAYAAGGLIGGWYYNARNNSAGYVKNSVSTGAVSAAEGKTDVLLGGLFGLLSSRYEGNSLVLENNYYASETLPVIAGISKWAIGTSGYGMKATVNGVVVEQGAEGEALAVDAFIANVNTELVKSAKKATAAEVPNGKATVFGVQESVVENDSFNVRFVTAVNDLSYDKLIYKVSVAGDKTKTYEPTETTVVYEKILENYGNTEVLYNGEKVAADNTVGETCLGLSALTVKGVPSTGNYTFTVAVYGVIGNTEVLCDVVTMTYTAQAAA